MTYTKDKRLIMKKALRKTAFSPGDSTEFLDLDALAPSFSDNGCTVVTVEEPRTATGVFGGPRNLWFDGVPVIKKWERNKNKWKQETKDLQPGDKYIQESNGRYNWHPYKNGWIMEDTQG